MQATQTCRADVPCVRMTLDADSSLVRVRQAQDDSGFTLFSVRVIGALAGAPVTSHELLVRGYTDGIECSTFGQATVAVLGSAANGRPQILTSAGPLTLDTAGVRVGCPQCAHVRAQQSDSLVAMYRTPAWDLRRVGLAADSLALTETAELVVRQGSRWINISSPGSFRVVAAPGTGTLRYRLTLEAGACT